MKRLLNEPVLVGAVTRAVVALAAAFGFNATAEEVVTVLVGIEAILAVVTRQTVVPVQLAEERMAAGHHPLLPRPDQPDTAKP